MQGHPSGGVVTRRTLVNGRVVEVDERGRATFLTCAQCGGPLLARCADHRPVVDVVDPIGLWKHDECAGGECHGIERLCSRHSQQYQARYGRASNE